MKKITKELAISCFIAATLVSPFFVFSQSYDYYVDSSYKGSEEGTKNKPFDKISDAIDASGSNARIFVKEGKYDEKIALKKGIGIYGESKSKVILSGGIEMGDGSLISNLTVEGGWTAVLISSNASAEINNCAIKKFGKMGINALPGSGKVVVKNSSIYGGTGKGMYIELGRKIEISGNDVYGNGEEGIDIRAKIEGFIKANSIHDNKEGGIEIVVGSSNVLIIENNIKNNGASGIATQFYQETKKTGELNIKSNNIMGNRKYGLDCNLPSGGRPDASYWSDSVNLVENNIKGNGIKSINDFCNIIDAIDEIEEDVTNITDENNLTPKEENLVDEEVEKDEVIWEKAESISEYHNTLEAKVNEQIDKINATSKIRLFLLGVNSDSLEFIKKEIAINNEQVDTLKSDLSQIKNEETKNSLLSLIENIEKKSNDWETFLREKEGEKGIFGWLTWLLKGVQKRLDMF